MSLSYKFIDSPIGKLKLVASEDGLVAILWEKENPRRVRLEDMVEDLTQPILLDTEHGLNEYFAGERNKFSVRLDNCSLPSRYRLYRQAHGLCRRSRRQSLPA
jgi:methylated-DNA-[protein]-cysteine S-methyltransferase